MTMRIAGRHTIDLRDANGAHRSTYKARKYHDHQTAIEKSRIPLGRFQTPKDIGEMAASDRAENITGAAFNVDGGWEMH